MIGSNRWHFHFALVASCLLAAGASPAQTFDELVHFNGSNGARPVGGLVQAIDGNLYGTTSGTKGGTPGSIFRITPAGALTTLASVKSWPYASLLQATDGNLYGTTLKGGTGNSGQILEVTTAGAVSTLQSLCTASSCANGAAPTASLIEATDGNFYGTASSGGNDRIYGTVFQVTSAGVLTPLHSFCQDAPSCTDGRNPEAPLAQARNGNFYGTAYQGGSGAVQPCPSGCGTVFEMTPSGAFTTIYNFCTQPSCADGYNPTGVIQATDGFLYGATQTTVFKISTAGKLTTIYTFCHNPDCPEGGYPGANLIQASDGNFYGVANSGGRHDGGTIFRITPKGKYTVLYNLPGPADSLAPLVQDTDGDLYGTTFGVGLGTVFRLSVGLRPFVSTVPVSGAVGSTVTILGTNLTGTTSISFGKVAASSFTVNSTGSAITTTVPSGAVSGDIRVQAPAGSLRSNIAFRVAM